MKPASAHRKMLVLLGALALISLVIYLTQADAQSEPLTHKGKTAVFWHQRYVKEHSALTRQGQLTRQARRRATAVRKALVHQPSSLEAIRLAAITYGAPYSEMYRVAGCETGWTFNRYADNPSSTASGLFQFLTSTFAGTPYGRESIWSPYANALAAGWLWKRSKGWGPWVCKP